MIDLRSDTVTRPTPAMYAAMAKAPLGDDVLGDEPTVTELEQKVAELLGFEAAMFTPSGTMANQIALAVHCERGDAALFEEDAHMLYYEVGAPGVIAQVVCRGVPSQNGIMEPEEIEKRLLRGSLHTPPTTLLCIENTHNRAGGVSIPLEYLARYREVAEKHGLRMHLDGARMLNAAAEQRVEPTEITRYFESVSLCLSKGLGAPVGSVLVGGSDFITDSRRWRKRLGGGMRQSGLLAACGLVALENWRETLESDHQRARQLAIRLCELENISVDVEKQSTNFVMVNTVAPAQKLADQLAENGVACMAFGPHVLRLVLHRDIADAELEVVQSAFERSIRKLN